MARPWCAIVLAVSALALAGCDESDAVAVRIRLQEDMSGTVTTSALVQPTSAGAVERESQGAAWQSRVGVEFSSGSFASLSGLKLADLSFTAGDAGEGLCFVKIVLPRGEKVRWPRVLVPLSNDERASAATAFDPSGKTRNVGSTIKLELTIPRPIVSNGLTGKTRGTKATSEGEIATLIVPLDTATSEGDSIVWHVTWQK